MVNYLPDFYEAEETLQFYNDDIFKETSFEIWDHCVLESFLSMFRSLYKVVLLNLGFGLITSLGLPSVIFHMISTLGGIYLLLITIQTTTGMLIVLSCFLLAYIALILRHLFQKNQQIPVLQYSFIILFVLFEYFILEKDVWLQIRGIMMVFLMKLITVIEETNPSEVSFIQYCGYMFCPGNILFGPWISFEHYLLQVQCPSKKNIYWILGICHAILLSLFFLSISNCWADFLIEDDSNRWLVGYKQALMFRTSHYFISYFSEALILASGWKDKAWHFDDKHWNYPIANFLKIEFPTALAIVVTNWNKPMHNFLKKYIYRKWLPLGRFYAVLVTFVISSLFHGLELRISTILISLGVFSYLQILVRKHISVAFDICVEVYPCKSCKHFYKRDSIVCRMSLLVFSLFTGLHLIYLGVLMDHSNEEETIFEKWNNLSFISLWIMFINCLIVK